MFSFVHFIPDYSGMNYGYPPQPPPGQAAPGGGAAYGMPGPQIFQVSNLFFLFLQN